MDRTEHRSETANAATGPAGGERPDGVAADATVPVVAWIDYHCPYSDRAVAWLDALPATAARVEYRLFALEQVNRDPAAAEWRIWDQPLDYPHHRGRPDRRSLAAFLITKLLERTEPAGVQRRFRRAVLDARFVAQVDVSDLDLLQRLATGSGADGPRLSAALTDDAALRRARDEIAADWAAARERYEVFGVPTLDVGGGAPLYLRLERVPEADEGHSLFERLVRLHREVPWLLEVKVAPPRAPVAS